MTNNQLEFIGRDSHLKTINTAIEKRNFSYLISVQGQGGVGKTYLLRKIRNEYKDQSQYTCFPLIDFSQSKTRTQRWVMETIANHKTTGFDNYRIKARSLARQEKSDSPSLLSEEDLEQAFHADLLEFEQHTRCIFLFDTLELIQDTLLFDFVLKIAQGVQNSVIILAGRRNQKQLPDLQEKLREGNCEFINIELTGFDRDNALTYIEHHPAGKRLSDDHKDVLYLLSDEGIPIKLALALDWLSRGWIMDTLADYSSSQLRQIKAKDGRAFQKIVSQFERELVTQIGELGTFVDRVIYIMAYVHKRFNRALLELLVRDIDTGERLPEHKIDALLECIQTLPFVKCIEEDYFVLHDEVQRMVSLHIWEWVDPQHEERREISKKVIDYYDREIKKLGSQEEISPSDEWTGRIYEIERLHYQLNINLVEGYKQFSQMFEELEDRRSVELASLALDVMITDRKLPSRLRTFVNTYHRGWVHVRREHLERARQCIQDGLPKLKTLVESQDRGEKRKEFIETEVNRRIGEIYTLLGYCHRLLGDWDLAIENYERACELSKKLINKLQEEGAKENLIQQSTSRLAETLNDIANLQRMKGNLASARRHCKMSMIIRKRLQAGRAIGHCCYVMGMIMWESGNTSEAMNYLQQARSYYQKAGDERLESAWINRYEGYVMFRTGNTERALGLLQKALDTTTNHMGLQDEYAEILLYLSRIHRQLAQPGEALKNAQTALSVAHKVGNEYRIAECYLTLAITLFSMMKENPLDHDLRDRFHEYLQDGLEIARERKYRRLEVVFAELEANFAFAHRNYVEAFNKYTLACRRATEFKSAVFVRSLSTLGQRLHQLIDEDTEQALTVCNRVLYQWLNWPDLDKSYPEFKREISFIRKIAQSLSKRRSLEREFENKFRHGSWQKALEICESLDEIPIYNHRYRAAVHRYRAKVYHGENDFPLAHLFCERAVRIQRTHNAEPKLLGDSYLLLARIYWKLGNTAESADQLYLAEQQYKRIDSKVGLVSVKLEWAYVYFRTHQFTRAFQTLAEVHKILQELEEPVLLASALNLMSRLARVNPHYDDCREIGYEEADHRGKEALQVLGDRDWFVASEINLTLCILHYVWGISLDRKGEAEEAQKHFALSQEYKDNGMSKIESSSPMLYSVYSGMQGNLLLQEGKMDQAKQQFLDELTYASQTKHMRLLRALDLLENWLVSQPPEVTRKIAQWFIDEWNKAELGNQYTEVIEAMKWVIEYRRYIPDPI